MNIGIVCYASVGGSGVVATELAHALALRGHEVHLISSDLPFRWRSGIRGLSFERVETPTYPLFRQPQYLLGLTNTIVRLARRRSLDIVHAHYAVPHATAAYLAHQILSARSRRGRTGSPRPELVEGREDGEHSSAGPIASGGGAPLALIRDDYPHSLQTVTTLHGTDITLVGSDPSYKHVVAFSIEQSHGVTAVSESLKRDTLQSLGIQRDVRVIPNFLDCTSYRRLPKPALREELCSDGASDAVVVHVSNFRPVKRVRVVFEIFRRMRAHVGASLVMIGDGPDRADLEREVSEQGFGELVEFVGEQPDLVPWLSAADVFLLPSSLESFGMAALEAMACEVPVVASRIGGLPEVIQDGVTGFLCDPDDIDAMVQRAVALVRDSSLRERIGYAAAEHVRTHFCEDAVVPQYEAFYQEVLAGR